MCAFDKMDKRVEPSPFEWLEEYNGQLYSPVRTKRKVRSRKKEFIGWGSRQLIEFLDSIGKDTSKQISQYDVTAIINDYVNRNNLLHPSKKKRIVCDESLHFIFGRKAINRNKIYELLGAHFAENQYESDDDLSCSSDERENVFESNERENVLSFERKTHQKKKVYETPKIDLTPKSNFAAINFPNIKLVYLKKTLVEDLLKDPETSESKLVGSYVRIKSDPYDYLQKNSHQLVQVTGLKKASGTGDTNTEVLLQLSNVVKDTRVAMLSDDNFTEEECKDLQRRIKDGLLKRPTVVELQQKVQILHEDITKHWLAREIPMLQNLIDRANEKGWRRELDQYLEKKQLLQNPDEQSRLLHEVPKVIADEIEPEATPQDTSENIKHENSGSPRSILSGASKIPNHVIATNGTASAWTSHSTDYAEFHHNVIEEQSVQPSHFINKSNGETQLANTEESKCVDEMVAKQVMTSQVIDLSDDEEVEELSVAKKFPDDMLGSLLWHYLDPQGDIQGPFSLTSLKRWYDADYFPPDFQVWRADRIQDGAVLLKDILDQNFPS